MRRIYLFLPVLAALFGEPQVSFAQDSGNGATATSQHDDAGDGIVKLKRKPTTRLCVLGGTVYTGPIIGRCPIVYETHPGGVPVTTVDQVGGVPYGVPNGQYPVPVTPQDSGVSAYWMAKAALDHFDEKEVTELQYQSALAAETERADAAEKAAEEVRAHVKTMFCVDHPESAVCEEK